MAKVFISYSRKDIGFVRKLAGDLEKAGYEVWWDLTDLRGGDDWLRVIPAAIESSDQFIVVLSPNSAISDWVKKEYTQALSSRKKIIPIMLARSSVPFALNTINYVDFTSDDYAANLQNLLDALGYSGENPATTSAAFPLMLRKYAIPVILVTGFLLALLSTFVLAPLVITTATPSNIPPTATQIASATAVPNTPTDTQMPTASQTETVTVTPTASQTLTPTQNPTLAPTRTNRPFPRLGLCVESEFANSINVRSGPGTTYVPLGEPLLVGTCLFFSARNEESTWLQIAPNQQDAALRQYEGGWIYRELLGLGMTGPIDLPAVTLTPTPPPSDTPTITPTATQTRTPLPTPTDTPVPIDTETPTETPTP